ncbi:pentapeptide repeat-containing protein [Thermomonospora amylolytica]|uniref:pentapeptide repeat-containing protein n=1 Tax=Thermomonospora amylolytica TaxID=1411117 RepID=UPI0013009FE3|nr:pentapeptide repeat-containing protein [Thermomonospora amylolytica]
MTSGDHDYSGQTIADPDFRGRVFKEAVDFSGCTFTGRADFSEAVFEGRVSFSRAVFEQFADFRNTRFDGSACFTEAVFENDLTFEDVTVGGALRLDRACFEQASRIGPARADEVDLSLVVFQRRVRIELVTRLVRCERGRFVEGAQFLLDGADLILKDSDLGGASLLASYTAPHDVYDPDRRPRLVTLSGTDVANLTVSRVDLSAAKLMNAHNLDQMRIRPDDAFGWTPGTFRIARRQVIGDEVRWRAKNGPARSRWKLPEGWPDLDAPRTAGDVSKAYQALRKGREEARDEPGAADFYYGEMEMRRLGTRLRGKEQWRERNVRGWLAARGEYTLLWLYWLMSGYGLRAWRAFTALAVLVAGAAAGFLEWGFPAGTSMDYPGAVRYTLRAATSLLRGTDQALTPTGEWIELGVRFLGPVLLGLALLALRGRVRR